MMPALPSMWSKIWPALVLGALCVFSTLYFAGCKTRSPLIKDANIPQVCKITFECLYFVDKEAQVACLTRFGKNCNSTTAENDCAKRFTRLPAITKEAKKKMSVLQYENATLRRSNIEKDIEGCVKLRL